MPSWSDVAMTRPLQALQRAATPTYSPTGGIGPTHDDITADASCPKAFGVALLDHIQRPAPCSRRAGEPPAPESTAHHALPRMACIPEGGTLIVNSVSAALGLPHRQCPRHGGRYPIITRAMLRTHRPRLKEWPQEVQTAEHPSRSVGEGTIGGPLGALQARFPRCEGGQLPPFWATARVLAELVLWIFRPNPPRAKPPPFHPRHDGAAEHRRAGLQPPRSTMRRAPGQGPN